LAIAVVHAGPELRFKSAIQFSLEPYSELLVEKSEDDD